MDMNLTIEMLSSCAICGEVNQELGGTAVMFQVRAPDGHAGTFAAHTTCVIRGMHPRVRALLDTTPLIPESESPQGIELIAAEYTGTLAVTVSLYPPDHIDRASQEVQTFLAEASARLAPGMTLSSGPQDQKIPPGLRVPLVTLYFEPEHVRDPMWEIRDWLLGHPLSRVIEIETHIPDAQQPNVSLQLKGDC